MKKVAARRARTSARPKVPPGLARIGIISLAKRKPDSTWEKYYAVIRRIPRGKVATYGQIARLSGRPRHARQVGYALFALPEGSRVPWHRVVNAAGRLSVGKVSSGGDLRQQFLLEREGVVFLAGKIDLARYGWSAGARSRR